MKIAISRNTNDSYNFFFALRYVQLAEKILFFKTHALIEILLSPSSSSFAQAIIGQPVPHSYSSHDDLIIGHA